MKRVIFLLVIVLGSVTVNAQLTNTKWRGTLPLETPTEVIFDFKKDTVTVSFVSDKSMVEQMNYATTDSTITLKKVWGQSDCNADVKGQYHFEIKDGVMYIRTIADECYSRSMYLNNSKWTKM